MTTLDVMIRSGVPVKILTYLQIWILPLLQIRIFCLLFEIIMGHEWEIFDQIT